MPNSRPLNFRAPKILMKTLIKFGVRLFHFKPQFTWFAQLETNESPMWNCFFPGDFNPIKCAFMVQIYANLESDCPIFQGNEVF